MKTNKFKFYLTWLLVAIVLMPLVSCGGDEDKDEPEPTPIDNGKPEREKLFKTYTFNHFKLYGSYLVGYPDGAPSCWQIWGEKGSSFMAYLVQNGKIYYVGWVDSNEKSLTAEERESKALTFDVEIPTNINKDASYEMIALTYGVDATLSDGKIVCNADLNRGGNLKIWDHSGVQVGDEIGKSYSLTTIEILHVYNYTDETITVRHKGFEVKDKWYYSKATVSLTPDMKASIQGTSVGEEAISDAYQVASGERISVWSYYIPTGKKMIDASLILEIDGKEVKTPPTSSQLDIEYSKYYVMDVSWNGKDLKWRGITTENKPEDKDVPAEAIDLGLPSGTKWASYNVGASKPEEIGGYYAWGETKAKDSYSWSNYTHCDGSEGNCHNIGNDIGGSDNDVAHVKWGGNWRMPSLVQWQEVISACTRETVAMNGVNGVKLTSKTNGNSIFLPSTGVKCDSEITYADNVYCWLSTQSNKGMAFANYLTYQGMGLGYGNNIERFTGIPVRPVMIEDKN
jgi:hypothetical protein